MADEYLVFGNTYKRMGDFLKAEDMYQQANDLFAQLEDTKHQTLLYISLTDLYIRLNELETAQKMANKGLEIANTPETRVVNVPICCCYWPIFNNKIPKPTLHANFINKPSTYLMH